MSTNEDVPGAPTTMTDAPGAPIGGKVEFHSQLKRMMVEVTKDIAKIDHLGTQNSVSRAISRYLLSIDSVLSSIFVKQSSRNKEIGSQLVRLGQNKATSAGLPLFSLVFAVSSRVLSEARVCRNCTCGN